MAGSQNSSDLQQILKPFFARAAEAEERLSRLEAGLTANKGGSDVRDENFSSLVRGIQSKLVINAAETEQACETQAPKELQTRTAGMKRRPQEP
ncbi:hypothetical protein CKAN_00450200 [Cinnamomum micranthum f. kanehirae]|uniref:Uncharacterized protein n=1 Tax=Cinnamomum micranthum f. kanehirae TaxID=337451 RepID=A0A3S3M2W0_9MAGN|nr:hypothetical protein CKAN_00450200 [Cinnamomum micranthum f. kanehirae]